MADRILVWTPNTHDTAFYADMDYTPEALRLYAANAPSLGDLVVDIYDDGESIMHGGNITADRMTKTDGELFYGTYSGTFAIMEIITGGTSGAKGEILEVYPGRLVVWHTTPGTQFTAGETITGGTSAATATVDAWIAPQETYTPEVTAMTSNARLEQGENLNEYAEDFGIHTIEEGSIITFKVLEQGGASNITAQIELNAVE